MQREDGWEIDISKLPGPHKKGFPKKYFDYNLFKFKKTDLACLIYDIAEIRMGWEVGLLAIFKNKNDPQVIFNPRRFLCFSANDTVQTNDDETLIFIKKYAFLESENRADIPLCILSMKEHKFTFIGIENSLPYTVNDIGSNSIRLDEKYKDERFESWDNKTINLNENRWYDMNDIDHFDEIYFKEK